MDSVGDVPQILVHILFQLMTKNKEEHKKRLHKKEKETWVQAKNIKVKTLQNIY